MDESRRYLYWTCKSKVLDSLKLDWVWDNVPRDSWIEHENTIHGKPETWRCDSKHRVLKGRLERDDWVILYHLVWTIQLVHEKNSRYSVPIHSSGSAQPPEAFSIFAPFLSYAVPLVRGLIRRRSLKTESKIAMIDNIDKYKLAVDMGSPYSDLDSRLGVCRIRPGPPWLINRCKQPANHTDCLGQLLVTLPYGTSPHVKARHTSHTTAYKMTKWAGKHVITVRFAVAEIR